MRLQNKVVALTGAAGFLGKHFAARLCSEGAIVCMGDLDQKACERAAQDAGAQAKGEGQCLAFELDLTDEKSVSHWVSEITSRFQRIDVLVNNAATKTKHFFEVTENYPKEDWDQVMAVNLSGSFLTTKHVLPHMLKQKSGSLIQISSIYGVCGPDQRIYDGDFNTPMVYSASKGALISMSRFLATTYGAQGIRSNCVTPGGIQNGHKSQFTENYSNRVPMGRMGQPEDLLGALVYLSSDESSYCNGQNLVIDGGLSAW